MRRSNLASDQSERKFDIRGRAQEFIPSTPQEYPKGAVGDDGFSPPAPHKNYMKKFIVEQKLTAFVNQYRVFDTTDDGTKSELVAFAQQKRLAMKEQVQFYGDEAKQEPIFTVAAEKVLDVHGRFFVRDQAGNTVGVLRKSFRSSLLRSTYELMNSDEQILAIVRERSTSIALLRRVWGLIPVVGEFPFILKYHFDFVDPESGNILAQYNKTTLLRDHYELIVSEDSLLTSAGWQTLAAQAVMLDVMQDR